MSARALAPLAAVVLAAGCGWHAGTVLPESARTVGVEYFRNDTLERDLEPEIAERLAESVVTLVDAPLDTPARADVVIRGIISDYRRRAGIRDENNDLLETGLRLALDAQLVDRQSGAVLRTARANLWSGYLTGSTDLELAARERAVANATDQLVLDLFRPVSYKGRPD